MEQQRTHIPLSRYRAARVLPHLFLAVFICAVILGIVLFGFFKVAESFDHSASGYFAIFLDNEQVYFGKIGSADGTFVNVTDVYYFGFPGVGEGQADGDVALIKLGSEVHAPTDEMKINRNHILYVEELRDDSRVVAAIKAYKN